MCSGSGAGSSAQTSASDWLSVHVMHLLMRGCHGILRSVIAGGQDVHRDTKAAPSLPASLCGSVGARQGYPSALRGLDSRLALPRVSFYGSDGLP
jgi:hypothetical protein